MQQSLYQVLFLLFLSLGVYSAKETPGGRRVAVIIESPSVRATHSLFFKSLEDGGYSLDFVTPSEKLAFKTYGEWRYDNLIVMAPSAAELPVSAKTILEFVDDGNNAILVADSVLGRPIRDVAGDCNVEFDEDETTAIDHFNFDVSDFEGQHNVIAVDPSSITSAAVIFPTTIDAPVLFRGIAQDIEEDSALLFSILGGYSTTYSHAPVEKIDEVHVAGKKTTLVSTLQARNNARIVFAGSMDLFSDKFFRSPVQKFSADGSAKSYPKSGNEQFCKQLAQWTFQERGILRAVNVTHHRKGEHQAPFTYTVKEKIEYSVEIQEWRGKKWEPFTGQDVQLEFRMLDPYVRLTLKNEGNGKYKTAFTIPDIYGVFTFKIEYTRRGYGFLNSITRTPVRPFRHNEYERFIDSAYPYYASAFSMMGGLWIFSWFFLYSKK